MIEAVAAFLVWLGAALVVLADGRRGLALGLALLTIGFGALAWATGITLGAAAVTAGGLVASWQCWRSTPATWGVMPAGSTPRLLLCVGSGLLALWVAASVATETGAPLRFAVLVGLGLMAARVLAGREVPVVLTSIACLALALAAAPGLAAASSGSAPDIVGGLVAAGVMIVPAAGRETGLAQSAQSGSDGT